MKIVVISFLLALAFLTLLLIIFAAACSFFAWVRKRGFLADWWVKLETQNWSNLPLIATANLEEYLNAQLGQSAFSLRAFAVGSLSTAILAGICLARFSALITGNVDFIGVAVAAGVPATVDTLVKGVCRLLLRGVNRLASGWSSRGQLTRRVALTTAALLYVMLAALSYASIGMCLVAVQILNDIIAQHWSNYPAALLKIPAVITRWPHILHNVAQGAPPPLLGFDLALILPAGLSSVLLAITILACLLVAASERRIRRRFATALESMENLSVEKLEIRVAVLNYLAALLGAICTVVWLLDSYLYHWTS